VRSLFVTLLLVLCAAGCGDEPMMSGDPDLSAHFDDLAIACTGGGGTCQGQPCGAGCKCLVLETTIESDAGSMPGGPIGICSCSALSPSDGPWVCCGGMFCQIGTTPAPTCPNDSCSL
jgi:hypothetical protein